MKFSMSNEAAVEGFMGLQKLKGNADVAFGGQPWEAEKADLSSAIDEMFANNKKI